MMTEHSHLLHNLHRCASQLDLRFQALQALKPGVDVDYDESISKISIIFSQMKGMLAPFEKHPGTSTIVQPPKAFSKKAVLIDDEQNIGDEWKYEGLLLGLEVVHYICEQDFIDDIRTIDPAWPIYIDWFLSSSRGSLDTIATIKRLGFINLYITTQLPSLVPDNPYVPRDRILGKGIPWR